ncbi:hypothetical protein QNH10_06185 [Sporosarcina thermotolerans]|uniref:hypothetical protein n=1 Tax=Sporosarcina thermotolerans TaxID=633404 RepID=UPI0024BD24D6|nr:hypothetical protein [Sporosarcina thermotolerans]WHT49209.1 hypothetical protein QNH10_06185 [Sporosarcina thermotolerans]
MDGNWAAISEKQYEQLNYFAVTSKSQNFPVHSIMDQHVSMFTVRASAEERRLVAEIGVEPMVQWDSFALIIQPCTITMTARYWKCGKWVQNGTGSRDSIFYIKLSPPSLFRSLF